MMGTYHTVSVEVKYSAMTEIFVPDGEDVSSVIEREVEARMDEMPAEVDEFMFYDFEYSVN